MRTVRLAWAEIARNRSTLHRIALVFLLVVPTLYGAIYLWSNWDPYGKLDRVPVAVVNEDEAVTVDGREVAGGDLVVEKFEADPSFLWVVTDADDAADGLESGRYYLTITIPRDFSARLASGAELTPERAEIVIHRNDANGYVIGVMAETVQAKLQEQINAAATQAYFESVYGDLGKLRAGLGRADEGARELRDGLGDAKDGAHTLADGLADGAPGARDLADGATRVADGADQVADGTQQIADLINPIADDLVPAIPGVADGAVAVTDAVADVAGTVSGGADALTGRVDAVDTALADLVAAHPELASDPAFATVRDAVGAVDTRVGEVDQALGDIHADADRLATDAHALQDAVPDLQTKVRDGQSKVNELNDGAHEVSEGAGQVRDGAEELATKLADAATGSADLATGLDTAVDGTDALVTGLDELVAAVPAMDPDQAEANAAILGNPTDVRLEVANDAGVYGRGLAPFFFAISLWVFGIVVFLVLRPTSGRALVSRAPSWRVALVGWLPILGMGLTGAYLLLGVATFALGLDPVSWWGSVGVVTLAVAVFTLLAHLCRAGLGLVGSAVLLVVLMLQLAASGGIYPPETLPPFLEWLHPYLPMTYLIEALRVTFTGGSPAVLQRAVTVLALVGVAAFCATWAVIARKRTWTMADVHPPLAD
ncbi:putative membrane protein [Salana multivorans]|uniref:Putative membrane protein n=1 Tax=Salana multivorans TaxID=120377 RepID=A0A3N2D2I5_9MICO|nr:YhgE/Pip domain-containing protein [Salana multivorans]ROR93985.1 putative membrane protein [Salana multivorans]